MSRKTPVLFGIAAAFLCLAALWGYGYLARQRNAARTQIADLSECRDMMWRIEDLNRRPVLAADREKLASEITGLIEQASRRAGIAPQALVRIEPAAPRRVGDTPYREKPTQVFLRNVTLKQLTTLTYNLTHQEAGLYTSSIRLAAPRREESSDQWTVELVLTYLIYEPARIESIEVTKP